MRSYIGVIINLSDKEAFNQIEYIIKDFAQYLNNIDLIDISKLIKKKKIYYKKLENVSILRPKNINEIESLFQSKNYILLNRLNLSPVYFKVNHMLAKKKVKNFVISNLGYNPTDQSKKNSLISIKFFFFSKLKYFFTRILILLGILPRVDYYFEASSHIIDSIKKGISYKILEKTKFINICYYKNLVKINSRFYDQYKNTSLSEKFITFIDGMPFYHKDVTNREGGRNITLKKLYYKNLNIFLKKISKRLKKKVIICLHPKNTQSIRERDFGKFKCIKYSSEKYINHSCIVILHESSLIVQAAMLKKKIIILTGKILGDYFNNRSLMYSKILGAQHYDIEKIQDINLKNIRGFTNNLLYRTKKYEKFIKNNIVSNSRKSGPVQILSYFSKNKIIDTDISV